MLMQSNHVSHRASQARQCSSLGGRRATDASVLLDVKKGHRAATSCCFVNQGWWGAPTHVLLTRHSINAPCTSPFKHQHPLS